MDSIITKVHYTLPKSDLIDSIPELKLMFPFSDFDFNKLLKSLKEFKKGYGSLPIRNNALMRFEDEVLSDFIGEIEESAYKSTMKYINKYSTNDLNKASKLREFVNILDCIYIHQGSTSEMKRVFNCLLVSKYDIVKRLKLQFPDLFTQDEVIEDKDELRIERGLGENNKIDELSVVKEDSNYNDVSKSKKANLVEAKSDKLIGYKTVWDIYRKKDFLIEAFQEFKIDLVSNKFVNSVRVENLINVFTGQTIKNKVNWEGKHNDLKCLLVFFKSQQIIHDRNVFKNANLYFKIKDINEDYNLSNVARGKSKNEKNIHKICKSLIYSLSDEGINEFEKKKKK